MSTFRTYVMNVAELTHSTAYFDYNEDDEEVATMYSADDSDVLLVTDQMPWGEMLQEYKEHTLH